MNERILELAKQAGHRYYPSSNSGPLRVEYLTPELEKFAELIVQDCTRIIANQAWESRTDGANGDWTEYDSLSRVAGQIKQHFGVQE